MGERKEERTPAAEAFGQEELERRMAAETVWAGHPVKFYDSVDSTNLRAIQEAEDGAPEGTLVVADVQTAGRGRRGRSWQSPAGVNAYFTLLLRPDYKPERASMVTLVMALAVAEGIEAACGLRARIKWPNDIVVNGRKVCGILTEMRAERDSVRHVVVGAGINVGLQAFAPELADKAVSLQAECGFRIPRAFLIARVMKAFEARYGTFRETLDLSGLRETYDGLLVNRDREVCVLDPAGAFAGTARGINDRGELLVELPGGSLVTVYAGEVSVRGTDGYV